MQARAVGVNRKGGMRVISSDCYRRKVAKQERKRNFKFFENKKWKERETGKKKKKTKKKITTNFWAFRCCSLLIFCYIKLYKNRIVKEEAESRPKTLDACPINPSSEVQNSKIVHNPQENITKPYSHPLPHGVHYNTIQLKEF